VARELKVQIIGDASSYQRALATSARSTQSFGQGVASGLGRIAKVGALVAGAAGVGGLVAVLKTGTEEFAESSKVMAQTEAVLKSTGGAAGVTAEQVDALATSISKKSGMDDEAIASGENLLLTFTNIKNQAGAGNDIFNQTTAILADMSTALGQDTKSSAIQLGKALNDPIKGVTALQRVGVSFTASQKEQIKSLVESGKTMDAQKLILRELTKEFGGSAEAAGKTLPGQLAKLKNSFEELAGGIVGSMAPAFSDAIGALNDFLGRLGEAQGITAKIKVVGDFVLDIAKGSYDAIRRQVNDFLFGSFTKGGGVGPEGIKFSPGMVAKVRDALAALDWTSVGKSIIDGITAAIRKAGELAKTLADTILKAVRAVDWVAVGRVMGPGLATAVVVAFTTLTDPVFWAKNWDLALSVMLARFGGSLGRVAGRFAAPLARFSLKLIEPLTKSFVKLGDELVLTIGRFSPRLAAAMLRAVEALPGIVGRGFGLLARLAESSLKALEDVVRSVFGRLGSIAVFTMRVLGIEVAITALQQFATGPVWNTIRAAFTAIQTAATTAWNAMAAAVRTSGAAIQAAAIAVWNAIRTAITVILSAIQTAVTTAWNTIATMTRTAGSQILTAVTTVWNTVVTTVRNTGAQMLSAVTTTWNAIIGFFRTVPGKILAALGDLGGLLVSAGASLISGFKRGIDSGWHAIIGFFSSAKSAIFNALGKVGDLLVGAGWSLINGLKKGAESAWNSVKGWLSDRANEAKRILTFGLKGSPELFTYYLGKELMTDLVKGMSAGEPVIRSGLGKVADMIIAAAKKFGIDARAALAVAMTEGGLKFGAVGDKGQSFGPFQMATFGELSGKSAAEASKFANSLEGINYALRKMAEYGAKGATGLEAMRKIIGGPGWGFERPKDPAAELQRAIGYYKQFPEKIAETVSKGAPVVTAAMREVLNKLGAMVKIASPIIGADNARGIIAGLDANAPNLVARAAAAMQKAIDAQKVVTRQAFVQSFNEMANAAIAAFDARTAAWKPFSQTVLDASQLQAGIKQVEEQLATAMAGVSGAGAAAAADIEKTLGPALGNAMAAAMSQISGAKTEAALQTASQRAQASIFAAITQATAAATAQAQTAVDQARAALAAAQAGGDPEAIAAAQQALDTAVTNQKALEGAIQAEKDAATQRLIVAEQTRHDRIAATQREGLAKQLADLRTHLLAHPEEWNKMGGAVQRILANYHIRLATSGETWANKFAAGIRAGIPDVRRAAEEMARAAAATIPRSPAKEGPLAFDIVKAGRQWAQGFGKGVKQVDPLFVNGRSLAAAFNAPAAAPAGGLAVNVYVEGALLGNTVPEVADTIYRELVRKGGRNVSLGLA
jgi:phage-related protein